MAEQKMFSQVAAQEKHDDFNATILEILGESEPTPCRVLKFMTGDSLLGDADLAKKIASQLLLPCDSVLLKTTSTEESLDSMTKSIVNVASAHLGSKLKELRLQKKEVEEEVLMLRKILVRVTKEKQSLIEQLGKASMEIADLKIQIDDLKVQLEQIRLESESMENLRKVEELAYDASNEAKNNVISEYKCSEAYFADLTEIALSMYIKGFQRFRSLAKTDAEAVDNGPGQLTDKDPIKINNTNANKCFNEGDECEFSVDAKVVDYGSGQPRDKDSAQVVTYINWNKKFHKYHVYRVVDEEEEDDKDDSDKSDDSESKESADWNKNFHKYHVYRVVDEEEEDDEDEDDDSDKSDDTESKESAEGSACQSDCYSDYVEVEVGSVSES